MSKVREFNFSADRVVVTFADGSMEIARFRRHAGGTVEIAGRHIGHAATASDTQLVVRQFFVDAYEHA